MIKKTILACLLAATSLCYANGELDNTPVNQKGLPESVLTQFPKAIVFKFNNKEEATKFETLINNKNPTNIMLQITGPVTFLLW